MIFLIFSYVIWQYSQNASIFWAGIDATGYKKLDSQENDGRLVKMLKNVCVCVCGFRHWLFGSNPVPTLSLDPIVGLFSKE